MDLYDEAELERKKQISRYATFVTKPDERDPQTGNPLNPRPWPAECVEPLLCLDARNCQHAASCPYYGRLSAEVQRFVRDRLLREGLAEEWRG